MSKQTINSSTINSTDFATEKEKETSRSFAKDLKLLFKGPVLIANAVPVFVGLWLAAYFTGTSITANFGLLLLTLIGSTLVMGGALVLNNWYEADIDSLMDRTQSRPSANGNMQLRTVLWIGIITSAVGFIMLLFTTLEATIYAFIGWFTYVVLYTMWAKRRYTLNTVIGAVSGAVTPLIGWAALTPASHIVPIAFALIIFVWQMPHTFAIAIRKYDEYKAAKVAMLPVVSGIDVAKRQMVVYTAFLLPLPFFLYSLGTTFVIIATLLNIAYFALAVSGLFLKDTRKWADKMFMVSVNYLMIIFLLAIIVTLPWSA